MTTSYLVSTLEIYLASSWQSVVGIYVFMLFAMVVNWYKRDIGSIQSIRKKADTLIESMGPGPGIIEI